MTTSIMPTSAANVAGPLINLDSTPTPAPKIFQLRINRQQWYCVTIGLHPNRAYVQKISEVEKHRKHSTGPTSSIHHMTVAERHSSHEWAHLIQGLMRGSVSHSTRQHSVTLNITSPGKTTVQSKRLETWLLPNACHF